MRSTSSQIYEEYVAGRRTEVTAVCLFGWRGTVGFISGSLQHAVAIATNIASHYAGQATRHHVNHFDSFHCLFPASQNRSKQWRVLHPLIVPCGWRHVEASPRDSEARPESRGRISYPMLPRTHPKFARVLSIPDPQQTLYFTMALFGIPGQATHGKLWLNVVKSL